MKIRQNIIPFSGNSGGNPKKIPIKTAGGTMHIMVPPALFAKANITATAVTAFYIILDHAITDQKDL